MNGVALDVSAEHHVVVADDLGEVVRVFLVLIETRLRSVVAEAEGEVAGDADLGSRGGGGVLWIDGEAQR